jgi:flagellar biosynthesis protein FlhF
VLTRAFRVRGQLLPGRRQRVLALVGPTGVGKTTTLAKLAGQLRQSGVPLSLISLDTYRIGAVAQMQIYAELLGVPFQVARSAAELKAAVAGAREADIVLVDSTGRSPSHREGIAALQGLLAGLPACEVHLAVSATTKAGDVAEILRRFRPLDYRYLVLTKLDEARTAGPVLGAALERALPISYLTTGQEVPSDLEPATPRGLADLLLPDRPRTLARE